MIKISNVVAITKIIHQIINEGLKIQQATKSVQDHVH